MPEDVLELAYEKAAEQAGWKRLSAEESEFSWEKHPTPSSIMTHFKVDFISGRPLRMSAKELCEIEKISIR